MTDTTEQKEQHRLGTINRWDPPEEEWAADYDWTRHRGPDAYPVPDGWVLDGVDADGMMWSLLPEAGQGQAHWGDAVDALGNPRTVEPDATAILSTEWPEQADIMEDDPYHELQIDGELVLVLQDEGDGWWRAVAEALSRYAKDGDYLSVLEDLGLEHLEADPFGDDGGGEPDSGNNQTLGEFQG